MSKSKKSLTGGQAAVQSLKKEKVEHVFGLIGSATMEMFDALYHEKTIKFIGVRDERTGTHMADGYARSSNEPGVILEGQNGDWVKDDDTYEEGFIAEFEDVFWTWDDGNSVWQARPLKQRQLRRGPRKGKGKGKAGRERFSGKDRSYELQQEAGESWDIPVPRYQKGKMQEKGYQKGKSKTDGKKGYPSK